MRVQRQITIALLTIFLSFTYISNSMNLHYPGFLCSIEGIDGSGKSTLVQNLKQLFSKTDIQTFFTREPGATNLGKKLRNIILEKEVTTCPLTEFLLFAADRAQHFQEFIMPKLAQGTMIISDRMADSSIAYQGYLKGLDTDMIKTINTWCMQSIKPDITIYLKISAQDAQKRISSTRTISDKFEQELYDHLEKIIYAFDTIFANRDNVIIIDAMQGADEISQKVFEKIVQLYQKKQYAIK